MMLSRFLTGAVAYPLIEICWRGRTHWTMAAAGGAGACVLAAIGRTRMRAPSAALLGGALITCIELFTGLIFNRRHDIWDYRRSRCNIKGQICLRYAMMWCGLSLGVICLFRSLERGKAYGA